MDKMPSSAFFSSYPDLDFEPCIGSPEIPSQTEKLLLQARCRFCSYGKFKNMESPLPEGSSNILIIRFLWVTIALIFFP